MDLCPGKSIIRRLEKVTMASRIFAGNAQELESFLKVAETPNSVATIVNYDNRDSFNQFMEQVLRHLHNYTASAKTLVEHSRPVFKDLLPSLLWERYAERVSTDFACNPLARFLQQLRDYTLHWRTPLVALNLTWQEGSGEQSMLTLDRDDLLKWDKWNPISRAFIQSKESAIGLHEVVRSYTNTVDVFMRWTAVLVEEGFDEEFSEVRKLQRELYDCMRAKGVPIPEYITKQYNTEANPKDSIRVER